MTLAEKLKYRLRADEGRRFYAYKCTAGKTTIGYGRNIDADGGKGLSLAEIEFLLSNDVEEVLELLNDYPFSRILSENRKIVVASMLFQLGQSRFNGFLKFRAALTRGEWDKAADEMLDSKWAREDSPERAQRLAKMMREG